MKIKEGSKWLSADHKKFVVLHVIKADDNHVWVHYRDDLSKDTHEYSCYIESFLERFKAVEE